jgi:hypothetical protein
MKAYRHRPMIRKHSRKRFDETVLFQMRMPHTLRILLKKMQVQDSDGSESSFLRRLIKIEYNRRQTSRRLNKAADDRRWAASQKARQ